MKKRRGARSVMLVSLSLVLILLLAGLVYSQETPEPPENRVVEEALRGYLDNFATEKDFGKYGFETFTEVDVATVADPLEVRFIGLGDLQEYESGTNTTRILRDAEAYWYPVTVDGRVRTKVEMVRVDEEWIPGEFGGVRTVQEVAVALEALDRYVEAEGIELVANQPQLVKIPILNAAFLYFESEEREFFMPAMVQPEKYGLERGQISTVDEVLVSLSRIAQPIDPEKTM